MCSVGCFDIQAQGRRFAQTIQAVDHLNINQAAACTLQAWVSYIIFAVGRFANGLGLHSLPKCLLCPC